MKKYKNILLKKIILRFAAGILCFLIIFSWINFCSFASERDIIKEQKLGEKLSKEIEKKNEVVDDPKNNTLINQIGNELVQASEFKGMKFHFKILKIEGQNAFSFPGGYIYFTYDIFDYIQSNDELAGILAHEIAHVIHNHALKQTKDNTKYSLLTILAVLLTGEPDVGVLGKLTTITLLNQYSREYEEEADLTALDLLIKTGYNPVGFLTFLERLHAQEMFKPEINWGIFQTHPKPADRINYVKEKLKEKGIDIDRRATANYLKVDLKFTLVNSIWTGFISIDDIIILNLSFSTNNEIYSKITSATHNLDRALAIDLAPYEISVVSKSTTSTLSIRNNKIISLDDSETSFVNKSSREVLDEMKEKIRQAIWEFKIRLPF